MTSRSDIRRRVRHARREVPLRRRHLAAERLVQAAVRLPAWRHARRVALYLPADGEIDVRPLAREALRRGKRLYLPALAGRSLRFRRWRPGDPLGRNRFGIEEPLPSAETARTRWLDLVVAPLVAFDARGNRLGMGGGFYDHTFAFRHRQGRWRRPQLVGAAYALQHVPALPARAWDVSLDAIITDRGAIRPRSNPPAGEEQWATG